MLQSQVEDSLVWCRLPSSLAVSKSCGKAILMESSHGNRRDWMERQTMSMLPLYEEKNNKYWQDEIAASKGNSGDNVADFREYIGDVYTADTDAPSADVSAAFSRQFQCLIAIPLCDVLYRCTPSPSDMTSDKVEKLISSAKCFMNKTCQADPATHG